MLTSAPGGNQRPGSLQNMGDYNYKIMYLNYQENKKLNVVLPFTLGAVTENKVPHIIGTFRELMECYESVLFIFEYTYNLFLCTTHTVGSN